MLGPFVSLDHWRAHRDDPGVVTVDVRSYLDGRRGRDGYDAGHLPGAVYVEMHGTLAAPASPAVGRHPLPTPEAFAAGLGAAGVGDDDTVLAYDDAGGVMAARLVWMLRATGHDAALIDGGLTAYDGPVTTDPTVRPPATFSPRPWPPERLAELEDAVDPDKVVLDARDGERYRGEVEPVDPRAGHIPGARSFPCRMNLEPDGRLLPEAVLRQRLAAAGAADPGADVVSYCGSGVTACHTLLLLEHLGLPPGRLYPGSWSQYSHTERPAATVD